MEKSYSIHAYQNAFLVYDNDASWLAACKVRSNQVINDIALTYKTSIENAPILFRDSLCNWIGILVSKEGNFRGFLPIEEQPESGLEGKLLASFLNDQFKKSASKEFLGGRDA